MGTVFYPFQSYFVKIRFIIPYIISLSKQITWDLVFGMYLPKKREKDLLFGASLIFPGISMGQKATRQTHANFSKLDEVIQTEHFREKSYRHRILGLGGLGGLLGQYFSKPGAKQTTCFGMNGCFSERQRVWAAFHTYWINSWGIKHLESARFYTHSHWSVRTSKLLPHVQLLIRKPGAPMRCWWSHLIFLKHLAI